MRASASAEQSVLPPLQLSDVIPVTSATLPAPAAMLIGVGSTKSGAGSGAPTVGLFVASWTRKYWPGWSVMLGSSTSCPLLAPKLPVPVALVYWMERPPSGAGAGPPL